MLGARIAAARTQAGLSQAELARRIRVSPSTVGMYEQGRREPSVEIIVSLVRELNVTADYLLMGRPYSRNDYEKVFGTADVSSSRFFSGGLVPNLGFLSREDLLVLLAAQLMQEQGKG